MGLFMGRSLRAGAGEKNPCVRIAQNYGMATSEQPARNRDHMGGLVKGLRLIEAFDSAHTRMTLTEAARRVDISAAAARRCLLTLCELGYVQTDGKLFWLSHGALKVAYAYAASTRLPRLLQPLLDGLSERSRESASLSVLHDNAAVMAARSTARRTMRVGLGVGSRLPLFCSAAGRALMAALPDGTWEGLVAATPMTPLTPHTVTDMAQLRRLIEACRENGYAACDEEIELGVRSIATPILNQAGETVAAVSISTRAERMALDEMVQQYLPVLRRGQAWARSRIG
jgi:IclR family pca regulon transcriptional regulator